MKNLVRIMVITTSLYLVSCVVGQQSRQDYFGYRNTAPRAVAVEPEEEQYNTESTGWQNPMTATTGIRYVPVITPWYDNIGMYGGVYSTGFYLRRYGWSSLAWGGAPWGLGWDWGLYFSPYYSDFVAPFGWNSFGFGYSCPWYNYNPYRGWYYRPGIYHSTVIYNNYPSSDQPSIRTRQMRDFGVQRPYMTGTSNDNTTTIGAYNADSPGGGRSRSGRMLNSGVETPTKNPFMTTPQDNGPGSRTTRARSWTGESSTPVKGGKLYAPKSSSFDSGSPVKGGSIRTGQPSTPMPASSPSKSSSPTKSNNGGGRIR